MLTLQETRSFVITDSVAILPPQTFAPSKLIELQMRMKDQTLTSYYFNPLTKITIAANKRNTFNLELRNDSPEAELTIPLAILPWISGAWNGQLAKRVSNEFTLMYLNPKQGFTNIDRVVLTIIGKEYEATNVVSRHNGDGTAKITFSLKENTPKEYPYTIAQIALLSGVNEVNKLSSIIGNEVYRAGKKLMSGNGTVTIAGTKWLTVNLDGYGEQLKLCEKPEDYGAHFKWGQTYAYAFLGSSNNLT